MPERAGLLLSIRIFLSALLLSWYSRLRFRSVPSCMSMSRMSFAVDGVGAMREDGGEIDPGESAVTAFEVDGRRAFRCPEPFEPPESCT